MWGRSPARCVGAGSNTLHSLSSNTQVLGANLALPSWFGCWLGCSGSVGVLGAHKPPPTLSGFGRGRVGTSPCTAGGCRDGGHPADSHLRAHTHQFPTGNSLLGKESGGAPKLWFLPRQCIPDSFPQLHCPSPAPKVAEINLLIEKRIEKKNELGWVHVTAALPKQIKNEIPKRNKSALLEGAASFLK